MKLLKNTCLNNKEKPYIFISYSHEDMDKVYPILNKLHENRYRLWYDRHIESGTKWAEDIHEWITHQNCSKFVIFISKHSIASEYVEDEVNLARKYKKSCLVVYLEDVKLSGTLELLLDRWQSINYYEKTDDIFLQMLMKGIPAETVEISQSSDDNGSDFAKKYQLLEIIGKGGSSTVYKAKMLSTGAMVTIKVANCTSEEENTQNRLMKNEKDALARIQCPFIPKIVDFGEAYFDKELKCFLVESFIPGQTLGKIRCPLSEAEVVMIILDITKTLRYLHTNGNNLVHCDIKPENIILDEFNKSYLIDFGGCVSAGSIVYWGTTTFAAPEQCRGESIDIRSDIYSLGITMKYLLEKDYLRANGITFKENVRKSIIETRPGVSHLLALIVEKMTDQRMDKRFQTLEELIITLEEFQYKLMDSPERILRKNSDYIGVIECEDSYELNAKTGIVFDGQALTMLSHSAILDLSVSVMGRNSI